MGVTRFILKFAHAYKSTFINISSDVMYTKIILAALCLVNVGSLSSEERELFKMSHFS